MKLTADLTLSPQGQLTVPKDWRNLLNLKPGGKLVASLVDVAKTKLLVLQSEPTDWVTRVSGTGKGLWGKSDQYLQQERNSWAK